MEYGIEAMLPPLREGVDKGYWEVMKLVVVREQPPLYWVARYNRALNMSLGLNQISNHWFSLGGRRISGENLYRRFYRSNHSFNHLRCKKAESDLVIILLNESLRT